MLVREGNVTFIVDETGIHMDVDGQQESLTPKGKFKQYSREFSVHGTDVQEQAMLTKNAGPDLLHIMPSTIASMMPAKVINVPMMPLLALVQTAAPLVALTLALQAAAAAG